MPRTSPKTSLGTSPEMKSLFTNRPFRFITILTIVCAGLAWAVNGELSHRQAIRDEISRSDQKLAELQQQNSELTEQLHAAQNNIEVIDRAIVALANGEDPRNLSPDLEATLREFEARVNSVDLRSTILGDLEALQQDFDELKLPLLLTEQVEHAKILASIQSRLQLLQAITIGVHDQRTAVQVLTTLESAIADINNPIPADFEAPIAKQVAACNFVIRTSEYQVGAQQIKDQLAKSEACNTIAERTVALNSTRENANRLSATFKVYGVDVSATQSIVAEAQRLLAKDVARQQAYNAWAQQQLESFSKAYEDATGYIYDDEDAIVAAILNYVMPIDATRITQQQRISLESLVARAFAELDEEEIARATRNGRKRTPEMF